jgi:hypothetical protein
MKSHLSNVHFDVVLAIENGTDVTVKIYSHAKWEDYCNNYVNVKESEGLMKYFHYSIFVLKTVHNKSYPEGYSKQYLGNAEKQNNKRKVAKPLNILVGNDNNNNNNSVKKQKVTPNAVTPTSVPRTSSTANTTITTPIVRTTPPVHAAPLANVTPLNSTKANESPVKIPKRVINILSSSSSTDEEVVEIEQVEKQLPPSPAVVDLLTQVETLSEPSEENAEKKANESFNVDAVLDAETGTTIRMIINNMMKNIPVRSAPDPKDWDESYTFFMENIDKLSKLEIFYLFTEFVKEYNKRQVAKTTTDAQENIVPADSLNENSDKPVQVVPNRAIRVERLPSEDSETEMIDEPIEEVRNDVDATKHVVDANEEHDVMQLEISAQPENIDEVVVEEPKEVESMDVAQPAMLAEDKKEAEAVPTEQLNVKEVSAAQEKTKAVEVTSNAAIPTASPLKQMLVSASRSQFGNRSNRGTTSLFPLFSTPKTTALQQQASKPAAPVLIGRRPQSLELPKTVDKKQVSGTKIALPAEADNTLEFVKASTINKPTTNEVVAPSKLENNLSKYKSSATGGFSRRNIFGSVNKNLDDKQKK